MDPSNTESGARRKRRLTPRLATGAALLLVAEAALIAGGQATAAPTPEPAAAAKEAAALQPTKADILKADLAWAAEHAKGSKAWAITEARRTGKKVVAGDETTATTYTVANPDGTLTTELTSGPERSWRGGKWQKVDVTLTTDTNGTVTAKNHPNGLRLAGKSGTPPVSLLAAKDAAPRDLVTLGSGDSKVTLQWKGGLPTPVLDGTTARYNNAVPGADVIVEATRTGFEQFVEIAKKPSAGAYSYTLPVKTDGLKATANKDGSVSFTDRTTGEVRATMPAPVMWDATVDKTSGEHTRRARVGMKVIDKGDGAVDLVVTPSAKFLKDPATRYPVTVDPSTSALSNTFDTYVQQGETTDLSTDTELDLGNPGTKNPDGTPRTARSLITWNTAGIADSLIIDTNLALYNFHSGNTDCSAQAWTVWETTAPSTASRWTAQPTWKAQHHSSTETKGRTECGGDGWINADVDALVQTWASAKVTRGHMGLRAGSDATAGWKQINSANNAANQPKLTVTYNYRPDDGTNQQAGAPFKSYAGVWAVNTTTPILRDTFVDKDGDKVTGTFQVYDAATNLPIVTPAGDGVIVSAFGDSGKPVSVTVPAGQLKNGKTYKFRTNAFDGTHYNTSWSPWRSFVVDTTAPVVPASVNSTTYPEDWGNGGANTAGTFDVATGTTDGRDVQYRLDPYDNNADGVSDDGAWTTVAATSTQTAAFTVTPAADGNHAVEVRTVDRADNAGPIRNYGFTSGTRDYNRPQKVDIKLLQPDPTAPDPAYLNFPLAAREWGGWNTANLQTARMPFADGKPKSYKKDGIEVTITPKLQRSKAAGEAVADNKQQLAKMAKTKTMTAAAAANVYPEPPVKGTWCQPTSTDQKSFTTRDEACLVLEVTYTATKNEVPPIKFQQIFDVMFQVKVDREGNTVKTWVQWTPFSQSSGQLPFPIKPRSIMLDNRVACVGSGCDKQNQDFAWYPNDAAYWDGPGTFDSHPVTGAAEFKWNGNVNNAAGTKDKDLSIDMPILWGATFDTTAEGPWVPQTGPVVSPPVRVRCDKVAFTGRAPGCVLKDHVPGFPLNAKKYPAAAAHAWLIQMKTLKKLGAAPVAPLHYLPGPERNATGYDSSKISRPVVCGKSGSKREDGWVPAKRFLNHPKTFLHPEVSGGEEFVSCDEYPFAATYESPGMSAAAGGKNPAGVGGGGECIQTVALKADDGTEHLVDDTRYDAPTWKEICGRSSMSNKINTGSMSRFGLGADGFPATMRLLDNDEYWLDPGTDSFRHCPTLEDTVKCDMK
ncbi:DNRLRE domain-containing protein [Streptomyces sp. NPDC001928]|uniref:DNRLRE domain-containing protein n=1 Tax=Streptomyces sp. NPDC001928 TaxID=3154404 RepID=UPI00332AA265